MQRVPRFSRLRRDVGFPIQCLFPNPESDTEHSAQPFSFAANIQQHSVDAVRLVNPRLPSLTRCDFVTALLSCDSSLRMSSLRFLRVLSPIDQ